MAAAAPSRVAVAAYLGVAVVAVMPNAIEWSEAIGIAIVVHLRKLAYFENVQESFGILVQLLGLCPISHRCVLIMLACAVNSTISRNETRN